MGKLLESLKVGSPTFAVETTGDGFVIVAQDPHRQDFDKLVRELMFRQGDEFVILPVTDGGTGYERAVILPFE